MKFPYQKTYHAADPRRPLIARPFLPVYLHGKTKSARAPFFALLDSGADYVLFPSDLAKEVGIDDITTGRYEPIAAITGQNAEVYYHDGLSIQLLGDNRRLPTVIGFSDKIILPVLGRSFFRHFKSVVFNEAKEEVELKT